MRFSAVYDPLRGSAGMGDDVLRRFADVVNAVLIEDLAVYHREEHVRVRAAVNKVFHGVVLGLHVCLVQVDHDEIGELAGGDAVGVDAHGARARGARGAENFARVAAPRRDTFRGTC